MTVQEYQCHQCKDKFDESEPGSKTEAEIKCPQCGSTDVDPVNVSSSYIADLFRSIMASGGG